MPEITWEGKYDKAGKRVTPLRVALPFQTVETVNESSQDRQAALELFSRETHPDWRNRLIWGDKKYILPALEHELAGRVDLIYIDPPFALGADFSFSVQVNGGDFTKQPSILEQKAYRDTWSVTPEERARGVTPSDRYLNWFYEAVVFLHTLLADTGSIYVHLDWHIEHYAKAVMDSVFGVANYRNDIAWRRDAAGKGAKRVSNQWPRNSDRILFYVKDATKARFAQQYVALSDEQRKAYRYRDPDGRLFKAVQLGDYSSTSIARMRTENLIYTSESGKDYKKYYLDEAQSTLDDLWTDILGFGVRTASAELTGFPTQKPEALLERILAASSSPGDLVLDCFCGSGTTAVVAERMQRRWIAADLGRFAIHTTRKRLLSIPALRPFIVQNLGKYERQLWQTSEFGHTADERIRDYRRFILEMFKATPLEGYLWLHGARQGRYVHVGTVDAPVTVGDVRQIATEFARAIGTGRDAPSIKALDVLGWDFAFELNEIARQEATRAGIDMRFWRIPREVLDRRAAEQGDVHFYELAALDVEVVKSGRQVEVKLTDFIIPLDDVPDEIRAAVTDWSQWIDYWAVDWDNRDDTFHNEWQTYRTRKVTDLAKSARHEYASSGDHKVVVKVIDILGNDTTTTLALQTP